MKLLTQLANIFKRTTEGVKNAAALSIDQQWNAIVRQIKQEQMSEDQCLRNSYPAGWFRMVTRSGETLTHWCPDCKTLSEGKVAAHCGSRKREPRPEGWRLLFLPKSPLRIF